MATEITTKAVVGKRKDRGALSKDARWYKGGIIYELHIRAFQDSNGDGTGDFRGLTTRLDYLCNLGITAIWLLPFYPSPLRDDGYDISDYFNVHPLYGTLHDFKVFLREAHRCGLRVITELVLNHTSDKHPWFQRARRSKPGSTFRNYYVWSDTPEKYKGTRIIFKDTEISNWTWDAAAGAFYWHRFYSHQPDLNFEHPAVHKEMTRVLDFWLDLGVDGVRLDAVPYLYEREGTNCENLPETHRFLKDLRKHVDEKYGDRMLLAEANQWPEDAVTYFGSGAGDECHMAFHFPLMPRLFMALRMEDRIPIVDILQQTPPIPETAQWAIFLRNHDELTLEMVTDEERDYMYRMYAHIHQARLNLGIRRRLAPLLGNDRKRIELLSALLFSLPGTPVIYYGDEIGMGENIYLGDRNGVRTPMQWSADKNAGFSRANPQSLYLPINLDPENHYEAVNVEVQERNPHSLLWWMRRLIALYKRCQAFGRGTIEFLHPENRRIFAYIRRYQDEIILVVANLSRFVQPVELNLSAFQSFTPVELFGRTEFPPITDKPYFLTLGPHAFYWFALKSKPQTHHEPAPQSVEPAIRFTLSVEHDWDEIFDSRFHAVLESALQSWLPSHRWYGDKTKTIKGIRIREVFPTPGGTGKAFILLLQVEYIQSEPDTYVLPLTCAFGTEAEAVVRDSPSFVIAHVAMGEGMQNGVLYDAVASQSFCYTLFDLFSRKRDIQSDRGALEPDHTPAFRKYQFDSGTDFEPSLGRAEQSNSNIIFDQRFILKLFRRLEPGMNPDLEILNFLAGKKFPHIPPLAGALEYRPATGEGSTVAMMSVFVPKCKGAWDYTLEALGRFFERIQTLPAEMKQPSLPSASITRLSGTEPSDGIKELLGIYLENARLIGERTAALHITLASETEDPNFKPEPFTANSQRALFQAMRNLTRRNFQLLAQHLKVVPADVRAQAQQLIALEPEIIKRFRPICEKHIDAAHLRHHGDYHLGQLLYTGKDFLIIDFEGEPAVALSERRLKRSPLRDVAGMVRSFHYAAHAVLSRLVENGAISETQIPLMNSWASFWARWVSAMFYKSYRQAIGKASFLPAGEQDMKILMDCYLLRKAVYELGYELNNRPAWVKLPVQGILEMLNEDNAA